MRLWWLVLVLISVAGCTTVPMDFDLSVVPPGCRMPEACYSTACDCLSRDSVSNTCIVCNPADPNVMSCDCTMFAPSTCVESVQVCVGRGVECGGLGALCVPAGSTCTGADGGVPPQLVSLNSSDADAAPTSMMRCPYITDVCCPGALPVDLGVVDANLDQSVPDLSKRTD